MPDTVLSSRDLLPFATAIVGYIIGAFRTALANIREKRRALNSVLYVLLQIRFELKKSNPRFLVNATMRLLDRKFGSEISKALNKTEVTAVLAASFQQAMESRLKELFIRYQAAVEELVPLEPFLAYRLAAEHLLSLQSAIKSYYVAVRQQPSILSDVNAEPVLLVFENKTLDIAFDETFKQLAVDILLVAKSSWTLKRFQAKKCLKRQDGSGELDKELDQELDAEITEILQHVVQTIQVEKPQG